MKIHIIISSTRKGRVGEGVAQWAKQHIEGAGHEGILVDLRNHELPFINATPSMLNKKYDQESVQAWSKIIDEAEAFVFVTPEYNHGYPGVLKNAVDWLWSEWAGKPAGIISYSSGFTAGARAAEQLKLVLNYIGLNIVSKNIALPHVRASDGSDIDPQAANQIGPLLEDLTRLARK